MFDPVSRTEPDSVDTMIRIAKAIPKLLRDTEIDRIRYEYMMYAAEKILTNLGILKINVKIQVAKIM